MQQSGGGPRRNHAAGRTAGRSSTSSAASASPSSSSSAVSTPQLGFELQQQQKLAFRQFLQQQLQLQQQQQQPPPSQQQQQQLRNPEGNEAFIAYQAGGHHGAMRVNRFSSAMRSLSLPQQPRNSMDFSLQSGPMQIREVMHNKGQGPEQHVQDPVHQAYLQRALLASQMKSLGNIQSQMQVKMGLVGPAIKDQEMQKENLKKQELMSIQASSLTANQAEASILKNPVEQLARGEKQMEEGQLKADQQDMLKSPPIVTGHLLASNGTQPTQLQEACSSIQNAANDPFLIAQLQAMQSWALEHNVDLSLPANANLIGQLLPLWQSKMTAMQKPNENTLMPVPKPQVLSPPQVESDNSVGGNMSHDLSGQVGPGKGRETFPSETFSAAEIAAIVNANNIQMQQPLIAQSQQGQTHWITRHPNVLSNGLQAMPPVQISTSMSPGINKARGKNAFSSSEMLQMQSLRQLQQLNQASAQFTVSSSEGSVSRTNIPSQVGSAIQTPQQHLGFTKQQLHVLKAQILAFRRVKRGERMLPEEVLQAIAPPPVHSQVHQPFSSPGTVVNDRTTAKNVEEHARHIGHAEKAPEVETLNKGHGLPMEGATTGREKATTAASQPQQVGGAVKEPLPVGSVGMEEKKTVSVKAELETECGNQVSITDNFGMDKEETLPPPIAALDAVHVKKVAHANVQAQQKEAGPTRKYCGPLFDLPSFVRRNKSLGSMINENNANNLTLAYDVKDLLFEEGNEVLRKKRTENLKKILVLLAKNLEKKWIKPDLVLRMQIEERKFRLFHLQERLRDEVDQQQQEIMAMADRPYRKFVRLCARQRMELLRQVQLSQKAMRERQLKAIFQWRKKLLEVHWVIRDARAIRNRGIAKYHERMLKEFAKIKDDDRNKRMEALKNNDVDRYREMLMEQQTNIPGDAVQRYTVLSSFLSQTEEYLHRLGGKIAAAKGYQEVEEATNVAAAAARSQGLTEEEVRAAAACAGEEVMIRNRFYEMNALRESSSSSKYYILAHAVNERVTRQPSMLRGGTLREYQLVGLQWMLSLYNNKLNGILADEMGLGKTVQVMALLAYLMEFKGDYGPHLIIVPNAVMINWKSELHTWLPSASCIFYAGGKEQRSKLFSQVCALKFNILVTTYEFVMYDRAKLSKIEWKYIVIDEAQRMKDRESVLARDLDRYKSQRRLLLTGTPLQNDLKELWSLLNLLLPEVFNNSKAFHEWFSKPFQKDGPPHNAEDDWLETEKKVIIIHRLHQILEPFMLRRRVVDVEGGLPPKVSIVLRCRMSAIQGAIYDWIKCTGTIRVDPEDELRRAEKNPVYQVKTYKTLNNRCMELRKACNHPLLNYPYFNDLSKEFLVRSCGKLWILDRILLKLQRTGHHVLLFSTMTKLLDLLEEYLQWRQLVYRRIDGMTSLEDREAAIVDFNSPDTNCFIFLLSIRAAGRGLNLQTADTVIIYDPDPNPKNEEQAVARAHRIGQTREVKVIYMEAVVDKIPSYEKEDELRSGGTADLEDGFAGKDRYIGSIESLIRSNIQQYKIDMADEVINAGRFDQRTTHEERRLTLETLLHDEERYQETLHDVPSLQEVNRMIARSEEELELFDQMDEDLDWAGEMVNYNEVPMWLQAGTKEVNAVIANLSKNPLKANFVGDIALESGEMLLHVSPTKTERKRGRPRASLTRKKYSMYLEFDDEDEDDYEASSGERNGYSLNEEDGEIEEDEGEETSGAANVCPSNENCLNDDGLVCDDDRYAVQQAFEGIKASSAFEEAASSGSSQNERLAQIETLSVSSQKFGSLSALDARPGSCLRMVEDEPEEGEIAASGDSHLEFQQSGSWTHDKDDAEDEQVLQPKIKRKRSIRIRPRYTLERLEAKSTGKKHFIKHANPSQLPSQTDQKGQFGIHVDCEAFAESVTPKHAQSDSKYVQSVPSRKSATSKPHIMPKHSTLSSLPGPAEDPNERSRESSNGKAMTACGPISLGAKMSGLVQRKCKNVTSKFQKRIKKDGYQVAPFLTDFWRTKSSHIAVNNLLDLQRIDERVDRLEYNGVMDYVADVQLMLKSAARYHGYTNEARLEARKLQDLFFDIMKIAFPDIDFQEARKGLLFPLRATGSPLQKQNAAGQMKQQKAISSIERGSGTTEPSLHVHHPANEQARGTRRGRPPKFRKESKHVSIEGRDQGLKQGTALLAHPTDLVICKKRRKDRDKSSTPRAGQFSQANSTHIARSSLEDPKQAQPAAPLRGWVHPPTPRVNLGCEFVGTEEVQWARPVKKMRTDAGKRRPSHV